MTSKPLFAGEAQAAMTDGGSFPAAALGEGLQVGRGISAFLLDGATDRATRHRGPDQRRVALLARALEAEVIPRLVLSRHAFTAPPELNDQAQPGPSQDDIETLTAHVVRGDLAAARAFVGVLRTRNLPLERIYLELFAPTARYLGELWEADRCDFASVTIGLCCLQQLLLDNSQSFGPRHGRRTPDRRVLLAPVPGEQHSFGLVMVGEFFRRQGWDVCSATGAAASELAAMVRKQWFSIVGLSLAGDGRLEALAALIRDIRRTSRNPQIGILVGGRIFTEQPELAAMVGADATSSDGQQAVLKAETLLSLLVRET
jgi:methanogenic corrinoid protein MtbC1